MLHNILFTFGATFLLIQLIRMLAPHLGLVDHPGGHKTHASPTPVVGGLAMGLVLLAAWSANGSLLHSSQWMLAGAVAIMALGVWDDTHDLKPRFKFLWQMLIVTVVFALAGSPLQSLGNLFHFSTEVQLGMLALPMAVFGALGLINGVNMLDGVDGLAGSVVMVAAFWFASCCLFSAPAYPNGEVFVLMAALAAFLLFNLRLPGMGRARVFMGDTGSMLLGFALTVIAIDMTQQHGMTPVTALWICALPVLDTTAVTLNRLIDKRRVNAASRDHLHHLLAARGFSVNQIVLIEALAGFVLGGIGVAAWHLAVPEWLMFKLFVATALAYTLIFRRAFLRRPSAAAAPAPAPTGPFVLTGPITPPTPVATPEPAQRGRVVVTAVALASLGGALIQAGESRALAEPPPAPPAPAEASRENVTH